MIFNTHYSYIGGGGGVPKFTYTGQYSFIDDGSGNWRIKFLTSGVFRPLEDMAIDVFLVGGGGGGGKNTSTYEASAGGGGGYTLTQRNIAVTSKNDYPIVIGAGGAPVSTTTIGADSNGGATTAFSKTANGGAGGASKPNRVGSIAYGGSGGSGGGNCRAAPNKPTVYDGQSDGAGETNSGSGQGTTTREFGETAGTLYSGGGGAYSYAGDKGNGGPGGGANGGESAADNTGGGGGGNGFGGSGIVVIRNAR